MSSTSAGNWSVLRADNGNVDDLLNDLCTQLKVSKPDNGFSPQLVGELFSALTSIQIPKGFAPLELISHVLRILSEEVVRAPLDHLDAKELFQGQPEAVQDLLEIFTACVHLRDTESSTITSALSSNSMNASGGITLITSGSQIAPATFLQSSLSSSSASSLSSLPCFAGAERHKDSPIGSSVSCSSCESMSSELSSFASSLSEPTEDIQLPCLLCQYLAQFSLEPQATATDLLHRNNGNSSAPGSTVHDDQMAESAKPSSPQTVPLKPISDRHTGFTKSSEARASTVMASARSNGIARPSKALRTNSRTISKQGTKTATEQRRELREMANVAKRKFDEETKLTTLKPQEKPKKSFKSNVIISQPNTLRPVPMPAPESAFPFSTCDPKPAFIDEDDAVDECASAEVSPHMARVLKKQYSQHLQWMASHGTSEDGLKKLEKEYENLLERHTARSNQVRKEICEQARVTALSTKKGVTASVRNLRTYARTQEQQLAHAQLEIERIARSKEARRRLAEERLLRETFTEAMRLQKKQLINLNRELAEKRGLERDRHQIYMQGMEHFYRTQLEMLQEALECEARDGRIRTGAQMTLLRDMRNELRAKLDDEMKALKEIATMDFNRAFDSTK